jgi:hypothetical protein
MQSNHYVDNKKLYAEMLKHIAKVNEAKEKGEPKPRIPEYIGYCIFQIATRLATKPNFAGYTYKDEMISDGVENCLTYLHNFDPDKSSNPFAYFTQIIYYAFLRRIAKEKKQTYIKHKSFEYALVTNNLADMTSEELAHFDGVFLNPTDNISELIEKFEAKIEKKVRRKGLEKFIDEGDVDANSTDN